jgi:hypothetical protein
LAACNTMKAHSLNRRFPEKVWVASILFAPALFILVFSLFNEGEWTKGLISVYILSVFATTLVSLPAIFLYTLAYKELYYSFQSKIKLKLVLVLVAWCCLAGTYFLIAWYFKERFDWETGMGIISLAIGVLLATIVFDTGSKKHISSS